MIKLENFKIESENNYFLKELHIIIKENGEDIIF